MAQDNQDPAGLLKPIRPSTVEGIVISDNDFTEEDELSLKGRLVESLQDGRDFLEARAATRDFFSTRTLGEHIRRRVARIGTKKGLAGPLVLEGFDPLEKATLQKELNVFEEEILGALEEAKKIIGELET